MILLEFTVKEGSESAEALAAMEGKEYPVMVRTPQGEKIMKGILRLVGHTMIEGQPALTYAIVER